MAGTALACVRQDSLESMNAGLAWRRNVFTWAARSKAEPALRGWHVARYSGRGSVKLLFIPVAFLAK